MLRHFVDADFAHRRDGDCRLTIFEAVGRALPLIFDVEVVVAEHEAEVFGTDEGCPAFAKADFAGFVPNGQEFAVAPQGGGALVEVGLPLLAGVVVVVGGV